MIGPALITLLNTSAALCDLMGGEVGVTPARITLSVIPQDQPVPCGYVGTDNVKPIPVRDPQGGFSGTVEVGVQTDNYADADAGITAFRAILDNYSGTIGDTTLHFNRGESTPDDYNEELKYHTRALIYRVSGSQTI